MASQTVRELDVWIKSQIKVDSD